MSLKAGGVGLNLTAASNVFLMVILARLKVNSTCGKCVQFPFVCPK